MEKKIFFFEKESFASVEDYDFFLNLAFNQAKFKFIHKILGKHFFFIKILFLEILIGITKPQKLF